MHKRFLYLASLSWLLCLWLTSPSLMAQKIAQSYFFDGDEVVFEFDSRDYRRATRDGAAEQLDFADLDITEVIVSGDFNNWSREGWKMKKMGRYRYQLRKKIEDFNDAFTWEFKFLVNGKYWAEPEPNFPGRKMMPNDFLEEVYNLNLYNIVPRPDGNACFTLDGFRDADRVILAGSFNAWNEQQLRMNRTGAGWELCIDLAPGRYEYKFIADGNWLHDPANPERVRNEHGTFNSILSITKTVTFQLHGFPDARQVVLAGSFNGWNEKKTRMNLENGVWTIAMELPGGKHYYKFIVDGQWMTDPRNHLREKDRDGNVNSVLIVQ